MRFREFLQKQDDEDLLDEVSVYISVELLDEAVLALESVWVDSGYKDWVYRIDPARPEMKQERHIHITRERHKAAKNRQASWDIHGHRHDRKTFDTAVGNNAYVRDLAKRVLRLGDSMVLEDINSGSLTVTQDVYLSDDGKSGCVVFSISSSGA